MTENDPGILSKLLAGVGAALAALGTWAWGHTHKRIDTKANASELRALAERVEEHTIHRDVFIEHAKSDDQRLEDIGKEIGSLRNNQAKIFDQIRDMEKTAAARHEDLLKAIYNK